MLDIVERSVQNAGMSYHRMDGSTAMSNRARLVDDFNDNPAVFVFLLTTKVGGVGINLTGANRYAHTLSTMEVRVPIWWERGPQKRLQVSVYYDKDPMIQKDCSESDGLTARSIKNRCQILDQ